ncbi:MAG: DNA helicase RecQ [bacterium]
MTNQAVELLKTIFGYEDFRPLQRQIIENVLHKRDTLVIMPTGSGKSLCYQIPALILEGLTVVVSPLISLMKDQVEQLTALGVPAVYLNSSLSPAQYQENVNRIRSHQVKLLYVAPETLLTNRLQTLLASQKLACFTIDEAHCISEWGHDFRPEYRQLIEARRAYPEAVCIALTATATPRVQQDIKESLGFGKSNEFLASFNRTNLFLRVVEKVNPAIQTIEFLREFPEKSGIIYCFSRRQVEDLSEFLDSQGLSVKPYHAGMSDDVRQRNQELFICDDVQIIVATIAFGMGINKPNVRFVIHYDLPKNIESYYQQIGRAGRDGLRSECLLLLGYSDIQKIRFLIDQKEGQERRVASTHLNAMLHLAETDVCRRIPLLTYFGEEYSKDNCGMCDNCLADDKKLEDITIPAQKFLSCVKRTKEMFGAAHIIDVLRGSASQKVFRFDHQHLSTYGIGTEFSKKQWMHLSRQFIQKELIYQDPQYGSLKLTDKAYLVLRGTEKVTGKIEAERMEVTISAGPEQEYDIELFNYLRKRRKMLADAEEVPPYVIFQDKTLIEMAAFFPQSRENLQKMYGVGSTKLNKYGMRFLNDIYGYCKRKGIHDRTYMKSGGAHTMSSDRTLSGGKRKFVIVGEAFNQGKRLEELEKEFGIKRVTVLDNLYRFVRNGFSFGEDRADYLFNLSNLLPEEVEAVCDKFSELGTEALRPVYEAFDERIDYEVLKCLRLAYLARQGGEDRVEVSE